MTKLVRNEVDMRLRRLSCQDRVRSPGELFPGVDPETGERTTAACALHRRGLVLLMSREQTGVVMRLQVIAGTMRQQQLI